MQCKAKLRLNNRLEGVRIRLHYNGAPLTPDPMEYVQKHHFKNSGKLKFKGLATL